MQSTTEQHGQRAEGKQRGSCHCGAVRFEVSLAADARGSRCNCSICTKTAVTSFLVKPDAFALLTPEAELGVYEQGAKISRRFFCRTCGIHCFGRGFLAEVGGEYVAVNGNCLDDLEPTLLTLIYWDGRHDNWQNGPRDHAWPVHGQGA